MQSVVQKIEGKYKKKAVVDIKSGDTVRVHQKIVEGKKERVQIFEGLIIRTSRRDSLTLNFTVRRITGGIGVEKTFMIHSPSILKVEVTKRSKVRRNYLSYMRERTGKSARLSGVEFDRDTINAVVDEEAEAEEAKIKEEQAEAYDPEEAKREKAQEKAEAASASGDSVEKAENAKPEEQPKEKPVSKSTDTDQNT